MTDVDDERRTTGVGGAEEFERDLLQFDGIALSSMSSHGKDCCDAVQLAVTSRLAFPTVAACLAAVPRVVQWGPTRWPAHWCDLEREPGSFAGDCGVHAALAADILVAFGVEHRRAQIAIRSPRGHHAHWRAAWAEAGANPAWIGQSVVYHEVLAVGDRFWDPSEGRWFAGVDGALLAGRVVAVRVQGGQWDVSRDEARRRG